LPILRQNFSERDPVKVGIAALLGIALLGVVLFSASPLVRALSSISYTAVFGDAGGLQVGDDVRLNGAKVGKVDKVRLDDDHVDVDFTVAHVGRLGLATRAVIKAGTVLGTKFLGVQPEGPGELAGGAVIPLERTNSPYDISQALSTLTRKSEQLDKRQLVQALNTINTTFADTPPALHSALDGVSRLSETLASRDVALRELLAHTNSVTGVVARRSDNLVRLVTDGDQLLTELNRRHEVIRQLLVNVTRVFDQLNGLVKDNRDQLQPALDELKDVLDLLNRNDKNLAAVVHGLNTFGGVLGDGVGGGPWAYSSIGNLIPTNLFPPLPLGSGISAAPSPAPGPGSNTGRNPAAGAPSMPLLGPLTDPQPAAGSSDSPHPTGAGR